MEQKLVRQDEEWLTTRLSAERGKVVERRVEGTLSSCRQPPRSYLLWSYCHTSTIVREESFTQTHFRSSFCLAMDASDCFKASRAASAPALSSGAFFSTGTLSSAWCDTKVVKASWWLLSPVE
jgi:hypothetical protein